MRRLKESDVVLIVDTLVLAKCRYEADADACSRRGQEKLAEQYEARVKHCNELLELLTEYPTVEIDV